ncbi:MAG TPA: metallophosphoesterase family protein [Anaerolineales bacterium]|nr:metallophosphoesterase family protein [Anaerolineales bacterium]HRQ91835.1 metallophosphoesterase family protein [Anaerolineales bacterium]
MTEITLGLIADTHIPDRKRGLDARILPALRQAKVSAILHAGDISTPAVLHTLGEVAPVLAVRGNTDWFRSTDVPNVRHLEFGRVNIVLTHGHINWPTYIRDKLAYILYGPRSFEFFTQRMLDSFPDADVIVFGHTHEALLRHYGAQLVVNPGSACCPVMPGRHPSYALLHIADGKARAELVWLPPEK